MSIGDMEVSDDGNFIAFSTDSTGFRQYDLQVKDLRSGQILPDRAPRVTSVVWAADNNTIFYVQEDPVSKRSFQAFRHTLGSATDPMVYEEKDELYDIYMYRTRSDAYIIMGATSSTTSEMWYLDATKPADQFQSIAGRKEGREYYLDHAAESFSSAPMTPVATSGWSRRRLRHRASPTGKKWCRSAIQSCSKTSIASRTSTC
jgi:oligopeptidase B